MSEAKLSAVLVAMLAGVGLTLMLASVLRSFSSAIAIAAPVALALAAVLALFASDNTINRGDDSSPKGN